MTQEPTDRRHRAPLVVKIGGSLLSNASRLSSTLSIIARARRPLVLVPGGGGFADEVRDTQAVLGTSDRAAHRMALLAMHQTGLLIEDMHARFVAVETQVAIRRALAADRIPVWMPLRIAADDDTIPADWSVTSDALAARLAERLRFEAVLLVKSRCVPQGPLPHELAAEGILDPVFGEIVNRAGLAFRIVGPGEERALADICLAAPPTTRTAPGTRRAGARNERGRRGSRRTTGGLNASPRH